jgi:hypothetical protein
MTDEYQIGGTTFAEDSNGNIVITPEIVDSGGDFSDGTKTELLSGVNSNTRGSNLATQPTLSISTSGKPIYRIVTSRSGALVIIVGYDASNTATMFIDLVSLVRGGGGGISVISSNGINGPATRSYSMSSNSVELAMGSDTYDVAVTGLDAVLPV